MLALSEYSNPIGEVRQVGSELLQMSRWTSVYPDIQAIFLQFFLNHRTKSFVPGPQPRVPAFMHAYRKLTKMGEAACAVVQTLSWDQIYQIFTCITVQMMPS